MEDMLMKYGMVILGVVVIGIMIMFTFKATKNPLIPIDEYQSIEGDSHSVEMRISGLCSLCLREKDTDRDCFILEIRLTNGNITQDIFESEIKLEKNMTPGNHIVKIISNQTLCGVRVVG